MRQTKALDYDYIIIGSGFGGSVSALRLCEKGYTVAVIEEGKRFETGEFGESLKDIGKITWLPQAGMYGIQQFALLKHVLCLRGRGVGGGSLTYANVQLQPTDASLDNPDWNHLEDWKTALKPKYDLARKMLGTVEAPEHFRSDEVLLEAARELVPDAELEKVGVGIYFGETEKQTPDPFFNGSGPDRTGCNNCGSCMSGCNQGAKNTLDKNYLYLAENLGAEIIPEHKVVEVAPLDRHDGSTGYSIQAVKGRGLFRQKKSFTAKGIIFSASALGTMELLFKMRDKNMLPNISPRLGTKVRTNSEALVFASRTQDPDPDICTGFPISGMIKLNENTTVEIVRMGKGMDVMGLLTTQVTGDISLAPRWLIWIVNVMLHPMAALRRLNPFGWGESSFCMALMQNLDNTLNVVYKRGFPFFTKKLVSQETDKPMPKAYIPEANQLIRSIAKKVKADPQSFIPESILNRSATAHILGGCPMGRDSDEGVIDKHGNVFGYQNMKVVDGSMVTINLAVNPSLTITALAEFAMDGVDEKKLSPRK